MDFSRLFFDALRAHGERPAVVSARSQTSYAQLLAQSEHVAANFRGLGFGAGARIGLCIQDNLDALCAILACWRIGATPVAVDFRVPRSQRARYARDFELAVMVESRTPPGKETYPQVPFSAEWRFSSPASPRFDGPLDCSHPAFLIFSSGTTGDAKAYVQSHGALTERVMPRRAMLENTAMRFLTPMALSYSATRHQVFSYLLFGGIVHFFPPLFSPSELVEALLASRASGTALAPPIIARMAREAGPRSICLLPDLDILYSIGGPARAEDKIAAYRYLTPGYRLSYSTSLTGTITVLEGPAVLAKPESAGRPVRNVRIDILDEEGRVLPPGQPGRIKAWTKAMASAVIAPGNRPFLDPQTMGADWGIPGDIGFLDEDGFLTISDRESDMIVRGGVNVAPQELERVIRRHPKVTDVAVVGFPEETMGQEIAAFIVSETGTVEEFRDFLRLNIAPDRRPREIRLVKALPFNENGKLVRRRLVDGLLHPQVSR